MKVTLMQKKQRTSSSRHDEGLKKDHQGRGKVNPRTQKPHGRDSKGDSRRDNKSAHHQQSRQESSRESYQGSQRSAKQAVISAPRDAVLAWGRHAVEAALKNPARTVLKIYASPDMVDHLKAICQENITAKHQPEIEVMEKSDLTEAVVKHLPFDEKAVHQGVVAVMRPLNPPQIEDWLDGLEDRRIIVMVLDQVTDVRNIGAIMRSARAFRARAIITTEKHCPPETGVMLRTASGAAEHIPLIKVVNLSRSIEKLQTHEFMVAGMTSAQNPVGQPPIKSLAEHDRLAIVMGAEGKGLRRMTEEHADLLVSIPIDDGAESLNVSNAAAVALYAAQRDDEGDD